MSFPRPDQQFVTYIKLTFTNGLKKAGLIEDPDEFHFSTTQYMGEGIHATKKFDDTAGAFRRIRQDVTMSKNETITRK